MLPTSPEAMVSVTISSGRSPGGEMVAVIVISPIFLKASFTLIVNRYVPASWAVPLMLLSEVRLASSSRPGGNRPELVAH